MDKNTLKKQVYIGIVAVLVCVLAIAGGTYAWFTFNKTTNVTPGGGNISQGTAEILISNNQDGPFEMECPLVFDSRPEALKPVSTSDLNTYAQARAQNNQGISTLYRDVTAKSDDYVIRGTVYLKSSGGTNQVYFLPSAFNISSNAQALASLRLGMKVSLGGQEMTYIFQMDDLAAGAESKQTVPLAGTVVQSVSASGTASYISDPSVSIMNFMAVENGESIPGAGGTSLLTLEENQRAAVSYWIYLEGCDSNCFEPVQSADLSIQLGFAGVPEVNR